MLLPAIRRVVTAALLLAFTSLLPTAWADEPESDLQSKQIETARAVIKFLEEELKKRQALHESQAASAEEVDQFRAEVTLNRCDLAQVENDPAELTRQLRIMVEIRERDLNRYQRLQSLGFGSPRQISAAQRRVAACRFLLERHAGELDVAEEHLQRVIELCQQDVDRLSRLHKQEAASILELNHARRRVVGAKYRLAIEQDVVGTMIPELRNAVELCEQECKQVEQLRERGAATWYDYYFTRVNLLNIAIILAWLEKKPDLILDHLAELVDLHEKTIPRLGGFWPENANKKFIQAELARDRMRIYETMQGGDISDSWSLRSLDL